MRKKSNTAETVIFTEPKKSSDIPSPYAHLPPSPPRYAKPAAKNPRLLLPPAGIQINVGNLSQSSNETTGAKASKSLTEHKYNPLDIKQFEDKKGCTTNTVKQTHSSNSSSTGRLGDIKRNRTNSGNGPQSSNNIPVENYTTNRLEHFNIKSNKISNCSKNIPVDFKKSQNVNILKGHKTSTGNLTQISNNTPGDRTIAQAGNYCSSSNSNRFEGNKTNTGDFPKTSLSTPENKSILPTSNKLSAKRFDEQKEFKTNAQQIHNNENPNKSKNNIRLESFETKCDQNKVQQTTETKPPIKDADHLRTTANNKNNDSGTSNFKPSIRDGGSKSENADNCPGNRANYPQNKSRFESKADAVPFQLFPININTTQPVGHVNTEIVTRYDNNSTGLANKANEIVNYGTYKKNPSRFNNDSPVSGDKGQLYNPPQFEGKNNIPNRFVEPPPQIPFGMENRRQLNNAQRFENTEKDNVPQRFENPPPSHNNAQRSEYSENPGKNKIPHRFNNSQLLENNRPLNNAPQFENIARPGDNNIPNRFNNQTPGSQYRNNINRSLNNASQFENMAYSTNNQNPNRFNNPLLRAEFGDNSRTLNNATQFGNFENPGNNYNPNRFNNPPPGSQFRDNNTAMNNSSQYENMANPGMFNGPPSAQQSRNNGNMKYENMANAGMFNGPPHAQQSRNNDNRPQFENIGNLGNNYNPNRFNKPPPPGPQFGHNNGNNAQRFDNMENPDKSQFGHNTGQLSNAAPYDNLENSGKNYNPHGFDGNPTRQQFGDNNGQFNKATPYNRFGKYDNPNRFTNSQFENSCLGNTENTGNNNTGNFLQGSKTFGFETGYNKNTGNSSSGNFLQGSKTFGFETGYNKNTGNSSRDQGRFAEAVENNGNHASENNSSKPNTGNNNTGNFLQGPKTFGFETGYNKNTGNSSRDQGRFAQAFENNENHASENNSFKPNTGNFQQNLYQSGNNSNIETTRKSVSNTEVDNNTPTGNKNTSLRRSRFDKSPVNLERNTTNFKRSNDVYPKINCENAKPTQIDNHLEPRTQNKENSGASNNAPNTGDGQQFEKTTQSLDNVSPAVDTTNAKNLTQFSLNGARPYDAVYNVPPPANYGDFGKNLQFGMKRRSGMKSDFRFINKMDQHFGNNSNLKPNRFDSQQLPNNDTGFQINPPLFHDMSGNQRFYEDIDPAPPVEDGSFKNFENNANQQNNGSAQNVRCAYNNNGRGNVRRGTGQMRLQGHSNGPPGRNQHFGNANRQFGRNQQMVRGRGSFNQHIRGHGNFNPRQRGRGHANQQRNFNASNSSQRGFNKTPRSAGTQRPGNGRFGNNASTADGNGNATKRQLLKRPLGGLKQNRFGKPQNKYGKLLKKANSKTAKVPKTANKEKKISKKSKKSKTETKDGKKKPEDEHIDVNKQVFGDFVPIVVGQKKPAKGHLKPEPETYWKQWWSLYGYVEKALSPIDPNDETVKSVLQFRLSPADADYRKRKRTLLVMGVAKILRHIRLNENDYAMRDIFNVLKYKHQLEDAQFLQHLMPKELERVEMVLKHARKKTRRALFYQSLIIRWHFSTVIIKRAESGESLKSGHARKLISDKAFNYLVWESIQELKKLTLEDWPGFEEFYKTL